MTKINHEYPSNCFLFFTLASNLHLFDYKFDYTLSFDYVVDHWFYHYVLSINNDSVF